MCEVLFFVTKVNVLLRELSLPFLLDHPQFDHWGLLALVLTGLG